MLSATDEKTPYEQGENRTVQSVAARSIAHKFLQRSPACTKPERVFHGFIVRFTFGLDQLKI